MYSEWDRAVTGTYGLSERIYYEEHLLHHEHVPHITRVGASAMRFDAPDICFVTYVGDLEVDHVSRMHDALARAAHQTHSFFLLVDLGRTGNVSEKAREIAMCTMRTLNPRATAVFGADFHLRIIATLITKAASLLDARAKGPVSFFAHEEEARAWLSEMRKRVWSPRL